MAQTQTQPTKAMGLFSENITLIHLRSIAALKKCISLWQSHTLEIPCNLKVKKYEYRNIFIAVVHSVDCTHMIVKLL